MLDVVINWGFIIKKLREDRRLTQEELVEKSGVGRSWLSRVETGAYMTVKDEPLAKLARGLGMTIDDLRREIYGLKEPDFPERNRLPMPLKIPIYTDFPFHAGSPVEPVDYIYRAQLKQAPKHIEGYVVHGTCLEPVVKDRDIIIVDREGQIDNGDIVACLLDDELHIARLRRVADEFWLENNNGKYLFKDCKVVAPVIEVIRRLK